MYAQSRKIGKQIGSQ